MSPVLVKFLEKFFALGPNVSKLELAIILGLISIAGLTSLIAVSDSLAAAYTAILSS